MSDKIAQTLNIEYDDKFHAPSRVVHQHKISKNDDPVDTDTDYARENLYDLIEVGRNAVDQMAEIARQSQHPRSYEVLSTMIKQMVEANRDLLELQKSKQKLKGEKPQDDPKTVNNNLYVGTTEQLQKMLSDLNDERNRD